MSYDNISTFAQSFKGLYINNSDDSPVYIAINPGNFIKIIGNIETHGETAIKNEGDIFFTGELVNHSTIDFFGIESSPPFKGTVHYIGNDTLKLSGNSIRFIHLINDSTTVLITESDLKIFGDFVVKKPINLQGNIQLDTKRFDSLFVLKRGRIVNENNSRRIYNNQGDSGYIYSDSVILVEIDSLGVGLLVHSNTDITFDIKRTHLPKAKAADGSIRKTFILNPYQDANASLEFKYFENDFEDTDSNEEDFKLWYSDNYYNFTKISESSVDTVGHYVFTLNDLFMLGDSAREYTVSDEICKSPPKINFPEDTAYLCKGSSVELSGDDHNNPGANEEFHFAWFKNKVPIGNDSIYYEALTEGMYSVCVTDTNGCFHFDSVYVREKELPHASYHCNSITCEYDRVYFINHSDTTNVGDSLTYLWDFGDGNTSIETNPDKLFLDSIYQVRLTATSKYSCVDDTVKTITVNPAPVAGFTGQNQCLDQSALFNDTSSIPSKTIGYREWIFGDGDTITSGPIQVTHQYEQTGNYSVKLIVIAAETYCTDTAFHNFEVYPSVDAAFQYQNSCLNDSVHFINNSTSDGNIVSYVWHFGEFYTCTETDPVILFSDFVPAGSYPVLLIAETDHGCNDTTTTQQNIIIHPVPNVSFWFQNDCKDDSIQFGNSSTISSGHITDTLWLFGDGQTSNESSPVMQFNTFGDYPVTLICTSDHSCTDSANATITIFPKPVAGFNASDACLGDMTFFTNNSSIEYGDLYFSWTFDQNNGINVSDPTFVFNSPDTFMVELIASSDHSCRDTVYGEAVVHPIPILDLGGIVSSCTGSVTVNALNPGSNYLWSDGYTEQIHTITVEGDYFVTITNGFNCTYTEEFSVMLNTELQVNLGNDTIVCDAILLDAGNPNSSYQWNTGSNERYLMATESGTYSVVVNNSLNCIGYDTITVLVNYSPEVILGEDIDACETAPVILTAETLNGESILWSTGETTQSISLSETGYYWLQLTSGEGCMNGDTVLVSFYEMPLDPFPDDTSSCQTIILNAQNPGFNYIWSNDATSRTVSVEESGIWSVQIFNPGCSLTDIVDVFIDPYPIVDLGGDLQLCETESYVLDAGQGWTSYLWTDGTITQTHNISQSGVYGVTVSNSLGCTGYDEIEVISIPSPVFDLGGIQTICNDVTLRIEPDFENADFFWYNQSGLISTNHTIDVDVPGTYWLFAYNENGCSYSDTVTVNKNPDWIEADFLIASEIHAGDTVQIIDLSSPGTGSYYWDFGDWSSSTETNPQHTYYVPGIYFISLNIENGGCSSTLVKDVTVGNALKNIHEKFVIDAEKEKKIKSLKLYPNPNNGNFFFDYELGEEYDMYIQIYNINGVMVNMKKLVGVTKNVSEFRLNGLKPGLYIMRVIVENEVEAVKFIKY
jgi:PKD repeat protein